MFSPFEDRFSRRATSVALGNQPREWEVPEYVRVDKDFGTVFPSGVVRDPLGTRYDRMLGMFSPGKMPQLTSLSSTTGAAPSVNRMMVRDPEQEVQTHDHPAQFSPSRFSSTVTHRDLPLSSSRVNDIFSHHTTRGFAV